MHYRKDFNFDARVRWYFSVCSGLNLKCPGTFLALLQHNRTPVLWKVSRLQRSQECQRPSAKRRKFTRPDSSNWSASAYLFLRMCVCVSWHIFVRFALIVQVLIFAAGRPRLNAHLCSRWSVTVYLRGACEQNKHKSVPRFHKWTLHPLSTCCGQTNLASIVYLSLYTMTSMANLVCPLFCAALRAGKRHIK